MYCQLSSEGDETCVSVSVSVCVYSVLVYEMSLKYLCVCLRVAAVCD